METRSKSKRKLNFENVSQPNIHIFFPENSDTDEDKPEKNYKIPKTLFPPGILEGDEEDEYVPNEETESEDEEYFEEDDELDYFEEDYEYLKESDIKLLNELKKTDISLYNKFKAAKDVIKSREISLLEILGAPISDDKRADLVEKYECLCQIPECTDEYIDMRDSLRNKFNRYIFESICIDKIAQAIMSDNVVKAKITPFNSKTHPPEKEDENTMLRRKLKELECSEENRKVIEEKIEELEEQHKGDERSKIKRWILSALALPFDKLAKPSKKVDVEDKIKEVYEYLDKELYGMKNVKERLMLFLNKKLREPNIKGCNIALIGISGIGKTRIAKCLAKCLDIPFAQVSFGGVTGPEFLTGHEYTYVGSRSGEISRCLTRMGSKNGILFCDEFSRCVDKKDIMASLLHITDTSQNFEFRDNYFPELTQDLSKLWFVYSMNDLPSDQAMLDRLEIINVSPYSVQDRKKIAENYLIPKFMKDIGLNDEKLEFPKDVVDRIVQKTGDGEKGVRDLERKINLVIEKSFFFISNKKGTYSYPWYKEMQKNLINEKLVLTSQIVDNVLDNDKDNNPTFMSMYL